jgi:hypothetical protein
MMIYHLLRPFSYWSIDHKVKWKVDWLFPFILASLSMILLALSSSVVRVTIYGDTGLLSKLLAFVQSLPGFYIAALAAIATFNRPDIDRHMPEPAPSIDIVVQGRSVLVKLTRRKFLCSMFAFLTAESIVLTVTAVFGLAVSEAVKTALPPMAHAWVRSAFVFAYLLLFWQMVVASFWGLYYLGEKLHQPDQVPPAP